MEKSLELLPYSKGIKITNGKLLNLYYENMSVQYAAISKSGKNDNF